MSDLLNQASLVMVPSGYKEDTVYSVVPTDGSGDLSFTRASNGTRVNSAGLVEVCPWNLAGYSEEFNNAVYVVKNAVTITNNATTAPNGTTTADLIYPNSSGDFRYVAQTFTQTENIYTLSVYAKAQNKNVIWMYIESSAATGIIYFDLSDGTMSVTAGSSSTPIGTMTAVGNGWYRCTYTIGASLSLNSGSGFGVCDAKGNVYATASGTNGVYFWGFQQNIGSTAKPYFPTTDRLNVPRLTYQNGGGGCPSLLLEKQSTNLIFPSEDLTAWSTGGMTNTANQTTSPDGTQNADKSTIGSTTRYYDAVSGVATTVGGTTYTTSFYAKKGTGIEAIYFYQGDGGAKIAKWNLNNGAYIGYAPADGYGAFSSQTSESLGNGWYRFTATYTASGTNGNYVIGVSTNTNDSVTTISGNGTDFVYIWGLQYEASSYATSYIPTTSSSATRVADACYKTGIGSLFGTNKGTFFWQGVTPYYVSGAAQYLWDISDTINFNLNRFALYTVGTNTVQLYTSVTGGNNATLAQNSFAKIALVWDGTSCSLYINGAVAILNQTISNSNPTAIHLNTRYSVNENGNTEVGEVVVFNTNLTNAELIALTTL